MKTFELPHGRTVYAFEWQPYSYLFESNAATLVGDPPYGKLEFKFELAATEELLIREFELIVGGVPRFEFAALQVVLVVSGKEEMRISASKCANNHKAPGGYMLEPEAVYVSGQETVAVQVHNFLQTQRAKFRLLMHTWRKAPVT